MPLDAPELLSRLARDLSAALGPDLLGLVVHGSYVLGDYHPGRSDLDLLAVLAVDPTGSTLARLTAVHQDLVREQPEWDDHVEVDYVSEAAVRAVLDGADPHPMVRICPGEPVHQQEATRHYLLNWQAAQQHGRVLVGAPARDLLPAIPAEQVRAVVLEHLRQWPEWVQDARSPGTQAYAVLTVCRGAAVLDTGRQLSKRAAADDGLHRFPAWSALITWARDWWYAGGTDDDADRFAEVVQFVTEAVSDLSGPDGESGVAATPA